MDPRIAEANPHPYTMPLSEEELVERREWFTGPMGRGNPEAARLLATLDGRIAAGHQPSQYSGPSHEWDGKEMQPVPTEAERHVRARAASRDADYVVRVCGKELRVFIATVDAEREKHRWVPCDERLPAEGVEVWCWNPEGWLTHARWYMPKIAERGEVREGWELSQERGTRMFRDYFSHWRRIVGPSNQAEARDGR